MKTLNDIVEDAKQIDPMSLPAEYNSIVSDLLHILGEKWKLYTASPEYKRARVAPRQKKINGSLRRRNLVRHFL